MARKTDIIDLTKIETKNSIKLKSAQTQSISSKTYPNVAIVAIARLENPYINEWIKYHSQLGFNHCYVYDNSCGEEQRIDTVLTEENRAVCTVVPAYDKLTYQKAAYKLAYDTYGKFHDYMLFIDIDEFFTLMQHNSVQEYIGFLNSRCPGFQQARINWEIYDDNGAIERDISIPVTEFFKTVATTVQAKQSNKSTKSIIKCGMQNVIFSSVHFCECSEHELVICNSAGARIYPVSQQIKERDVSYAKIRHYATKTLSEFMHQKMCRNDAEGYIVRDIDNRFFVFCKRTAEKQDYYQKNLHLTNLNQFRSRKMGKDDVITYWYWKDGGKSNAGDVFNKYLVEKLYMCHSLKPFHTFSDVCFVGSILLDSHIKNVRNVCGLGIQRTSPDLSPPRNANYLAVRGKVTKEILLNEYGISLPEDIVLCDPGLMMSKLYSPTPSTKKHRIGLILHWQDEKLNLENDNGIHHISILTDDIENLADEIVSCDIILSSSLHGIIFAHSYGIPAYHVQFRDFFNNGNYKFNDYYSSFDGVEYRKFLAEFDEKNNCYRIPFQTILECDMAYRDKLNPNVDQIYEKQIQFLGVVPFKEVLNEKYKQKLYIGNRRIL